MLVGRRTFMAGLTALAATPAWAQSSRKIALVIGNSAYSHNTFIPNARSDAVAVASELRNLGFDIEPNSYDLSQAGLANAVRSFGVKIRSLGPDVVSFFYYNGHGTQNPEGINYLMPVDVAADTPAQVRKFGTPVQSLLAEMETADNAVNIVVLDACRDWFQSNGKKYVNSGVSDMGVHASVLIAYAAVSGDKVKEPVGGTSSYYTSQLLRGLKSRYGDTVAQLFDDIQTNVYSDTFGEQTPLYVNGLSRARRWTLTKGAPSDTPVIPVKKGNRLGYILSEADRPNLMAFTQGARSFTDTLLDRMDILARAEINSTDRLAFFLGHIGYETGAFRSLIERFGYNAAGLLKNYGRYFPTPEAATSYAGKPEAIANHVYANRFENGDENSGDGWRYRGRGLFLMVFKHNYRVIGNAIGRNLVSAPDSVNDPDISLEIAAHLWGASGANAIADARDVAGISKALRMPPGDLSKRFLWMRLAYKAIGADVPGGLVAPASRVLSGQPRPTP